MSEASRSMTALFHERAGKSRFRVTPSEPESHATMNGLFRGEGSSEVSDTATSEPADELEARARALGCIDVGAIRQIAPELEELAGAALESALQRALREREYLAPGLESRLASRPEGLDGGAGHGGAEPAPSVNALIRATREQKMAALHDRALDLDRRG